MTDADLLAAAKDVLAKNDKGDYTVPSTRLYPHQWLWDSAFIAIGQAQYDPDRAAQELRSLFRNQWSNGMLPHIIFGASEDYWLSQKFWHSSRMKYAPKHVLTSGITQPPVVALATERVAMRMKPAQRSKFLNEVFPVLVAYHKWWYKDRDPQHTGLVVLVHPWENGLDNTPPWIDMLDRVRLPLWLSLSLRFGINSVISRLRPDTSKVPPEERLEIDDAARAIILARRLRRQHYVGKRMLRRPIVAVESLTTNCILVASNEALQRMAAIINRELPTELVAAFGRTKASIQELWEQGQFHSRDYVTGSLIKSPSINTFFPLLAGAATQEQAAKIVELLRNEHHYWAKYPVPSVDMTSSDFDENRYWQGPTWVNTNWLIIQGLRRYEYDELAEQLRHKTIEMVKKHGFSEYFSPLSGEPYGIENFSWTAALIIDLLAKE